MAYLGKTPSQAVRSRYYFTATGGETSLSGADDNANTLTFTDGNYVDVALNGVTLVAGTDYNTTTANTIGGLTALVASDVVEVIVYDTFSVFSGNVNGDFTVGGTLTAANITNTGNLNFGDNDKAIFGAGSDLQIYHDGINSYIDDAGTGGLFIRSNEFLIQKYTGEAVIYAVADGAVNLYYDNAAKLATTPTGINVTGTVTANSVGVGAAPNATFGSLLYTQGTPAVNKPILSAYSQGNSNNAGFALFNDSGNRGIWTTGSTMRFTRTYEGNSTADVTIDASGNVGIGTSLPSNPLEIQHGTVGTGNGTNNTLALRYNSSTLYGQHYMDASGIYHILADNNGVAGGNIQLGADTTIRLATANTERMRIDSSGNVGIGAVPSAWSVSGVIQSNRSSFSGGANATGGTLNWNAYYDGAWKYKDSLEASQYNQSNGTHIWSTAPAGTAGNPVTFTERMRIDSSGNVGIGTSAPSGAKLEIFTASTAVDGLKISRYTPGNYYSTLRQDNHGLAIHVGTGGTVSERVAITPNGITFNGDTAAANALDDYEEGTWNPTFASSSNRAGTWTSMIGRYRKIGNVVIYQIDISGTGMYFLSTNGYQGIGNLPFIASNPAGTKTFAGSWSGDSVATSSGGSVYLNGGVIYLHNSNPNQLANVVNGIGVTITMYAQ